MLEAILMIYFHPLTCWCMYTIHTAYITMSVKIFVQKNIYSMHLFCIFFGIYMCVIITYRLCWWLPLANETYLNHFTAFFNLFPLFGWQLCEWKFGRNGFYIYSLSSFFLATIRLGYDVFLWHLHWRIHNNEPSDVSRWR